jgi:hypothetical protein
MPRDLVSPLEGLRSPFGQRAGGGGTGTAVIVLSVGQSLNAPRGTTLKSSSSWAGAKMFVGGAASADWDYHATNVEWTGDWSEVASVVTLAEGALQTQMTGMADLMDGGSWTNGYFVSTAIGARRIDNLWAGGPRDNCYAALHRGVALARADGHTAIDIVIYSEHGEADAANATTYANYLSRGTQYYRMLRLAAAQALGRPGYVAPLFLGYPLQQSGGGTGENDRIIKRAIRQIAADLGATEIVKYQFDAESDRVHQPPRGVVMRGEYVGRAVRLGVQPLRITGVTLSGATATVTFNRPIVRDATLGTGQNLNTAQAKDGFEWIDNGTQIAVSSVAYSGSTATLTLAGTPAGTLAQQVCRIAVQTTTTTLTAGATNLPGSVVRADAAGWASTYDPAFTNYDWALPQTIVGVS